MAAATLSGGFGASANDVSWNNPSTDESRWEDAGNWSPAATPVPGDTVTIAIGKSGLYTGVAVGAVNVDGGVLWINRNGVLNAGTVNVSGGQLALSKGNLTAPQGIANISTLLNITGGTVERFGLIDLGDTGTVTQSGGSVLDPVQIHTPSYVQTGGSMVGQVTASTYAISGADGAAASDMSGTVYLDSAFTMGDGALLVGIVAGDGSAAMLQTGGLMDGTAHGLATYSQTGGTLQGQVAYTETFELSGDGDILWGAQLVGDSGAVFEQSGGTMGGTARFEDGDGQSTYIQTGGDMTGDVFTDTYEASGGTIDMHSNISFAELFALSGDASLGWTEIFGDGDAVMTQTGGTMGAWVSGIETYTMSGGTILQATQVVTDTFVQSGGTINGITPEDDWRAHVIFATRYELSGDATIGLTNLIGDADATMTQSGGTMGGHVYSDAPTGTIAKYTQTGGDMTGEVNAETYSLNGAGATSSGTIIASSAFDLGFDTGTATVGAKLSGAGKLIKTGLSTVVLTNAANDFSGGVAVDGGVLEVQNGALPEISAITVGADATLRFNVASGTSTTYDGDMTGAGALEKVGLGAMTMGGDIHLGSLLVDAGVLNIGNGAPEEASFESAYIGVGATVYVAEGATLRIRIPKTIANFGTLINDGTVYDDLDNAGWFQNNALYVANLASNTHDIHNNLGWEGNVLTNHGWIFNNDDATWIGNIVSNGPLDPNGRPGRIANAGGTWRGDILSNAGHIINDNRADESDIGYWIGDIYGNTNWIFNGGGGNWDGDVIGNAGLVMNGKPAVWHGDVRGNDSVVWNGGVWNGNVLGNAGTVHNAGGTWNGNVEANTRLIANIAGTDAHGPTTGSTWNGDVASNGGDIFNAADSSWSGNVLSNSGIIRSLGLWTGNFSNAGTVQAQNQIVGAFANSGTLQLTGDLSGITTLTNTRTLDLRGSGAAQTLSVNAAVFGSGSTYGVDIDGHGGSDSTVVAGNASLGGTVRVAAATGAYGNVTSYTIVSAGSISGTFAGATTDLAFLTPQLSYDATSAKVIMARNDVSFKFAGNTPNQAGAGGAVEAAGVGNPIYDAVLWLTPEQAQAAFDQLSGEAYDSAETAAIQSAGTINGVVQSRINQSFDVLGDTSDAVSGYAGGMLPLGGAQGEMGLWAQVYGAGASNSGSAPLHAMAGGLVMGADGMLGDWRLGAMLQLGATGSAVPSLNSTVSSTDYGAGIYAGTQWGATQLSLGGVYTLHDTKSARTVSFSGFSDTLNASYLAGTAQAFAELSHEFDLGGVSLTPYAGLAHVRYATEGFTEIGGAAFLSRAAQVVDATFATLGLGIDRSFVVGEDMLLTASVAVGWRHAFANDPGSVNSLAGGPVFGVSGTPIASDLAVFNAGLTLDVSATTNLDLAYDAQIGSQTQAHALKATWAKRF